MTFLIYSDPIVEEIRIKGVAADHEKNETMHEFKLYGTDLVYTEFDQKGKLKGYTISFNFQMFSSDFVKYKILARNALGEDSFYFKFRTIGKKFEKHCFIHSANDSYVCNGVDSYLNYCVIVPNFVFGFLIEKS